ALAVEGARGLIGKDDLATVHERPRNRHPLLLAARELRRLVLEPIAEAERRQQGAGALLALHGWHARVDGGHLDVLGGGGGADQGGTLGDAAEGRTVHSWQLVAGAARGGLA